MNEEKYGFVYLWYDNYRKMFYIGSHWGREDDGYVCSSKWMKNTYDRRPWNFKRRILIRIYSSRENLLDEEQHWLDMIKPEEMAIKNSTNKKRENVRYYNISKTAQKSWHYDKEKRTEIGERISLAKKGKSVPCTPEKAAAISKAKKGKSLTEEHKAALIGIKKKSHTDEWKAEASKRIQEQWNNGTRKRAVPKETMSREDQNNLSSSRLKELWANPEWKEKQKQRLSQGAKSRPPRSEESKQKLELLN